MLNIHLARNVCQERDASMTKNPKKSAFLLRVEKSGVVLSVLVVVRLTPKGKNKESVQNQLNGQRLTINAQGS